LWGRMWQSSRDGWGCANGENKKTSPNLSTLPRKQPKNEEDLTHKMKMTSPKNEDHLTQKWRWPHPKIEDDLTQKKHEIE
jgi:hypothetical protein